MPDRKSTREQTYYECGQCLDKIWYLKSEDPPIPCPDCGWWHKDKRKDDIPSEIKLDLTGY